MNARFLLIFCALLTIALAAGLWFLQSGTDGEEPVDPFEDPRRPERKGTGETEEPEPFRIPVEPEYDDLPPEEIGEKEPPALEPMGTSGWQVWGRVIDEEEKAVAAARVDLYLEAGDALCRPLEPAFTDEEGWYSLSAPSPSNAVLHAWGETESLYLSGRASKDGLFSEGDEIDCSEPLSEGENRVRMDFVLLPDPVLYGFVLGIDGAPVHHAGVYLFPAEESLEELDDVYVTDALGRFVIALDWYEEGRHSLLALKPGLGNSSVHTVEIDPEVTTRSPDLVFRDHRSIEGVAEFPDGRPIRGIRIRAFPIGLADVPDEELPWDFLDMCTCAMDYMEEDGSHGLPCGWTLTDGRGRFSIGGLKPGKYFVSADVFLVEEVGSRVTCMAGDRDVRLVLSIHMLDVSLSDARGIPVPHASLDLDHEGGSFSHWVEQGEAWIQAMPGTVTLYARAPGNLTGGRVIDVGERAYVTRVDLMLAKTAQGQLRLLVTDPGGSPYDPLADLVFQLEGELGMTSVDLHRAEPGGADGLLIPLPPGTYQPYLRIREYDLGDPQEMRLPVAIEKVEILPDQETPLHVPIRMGGRVQVTFHTGDREEKKDVIMRVVSKEGRGTERLAVFFTEGQERPVLYFSMTPGTPYVTREILEPGDYALRVELEGFLPGETEFTVAAGRTMPVEVWLKPK